MKMVRCTLSDNKVALINPTALISVESAEVGFHVSFRVGQTHYRTLTAQKVDFDYDINALAKREPTNT